MEIFWKLTSLECFSACLVCFRNLLFTLNSHLLRFFVFVLSFWLVVLVIRLIFSKILCSSTSIFITWSTSLLCMAVKSLWLQWCCTLSLAHVSTSKNHKSSGYSTFFFWILLNHVSLSAWESRFSSLCFAWNSFSELIRSIVTILCWWSCISAFSSICARSC